MVVTRSSARRGSSYMVIGLGVLAPRSASKPGLQEYSEVRESTSKNSTMETEKVDHHEHFYIGIASDDNNNGKDRHAKKK